MSDAQGVIKRNPYTVTHTSNVIFDQTLLSFWTIGEVSDLPPPTNLSISAIELVPNMLLMTAVKEIFADAMSGNAWTDRTPHRISRTGVDGSTPMYTPIHREQIFQPSFQ